MDLIFFRWEWMVIILLDRIQLPMGTDF